MNNIDPSQLLAQMRAMQALAQGQEQAAVQGADPAGGDFAAMLKQSIEKVNELQQTSGDLATRFDAGETDIDLAEVMVASQKARVAFEAMLQVRNRLVSAYQEVMNMQI